MRYQTSSCFAWSVFSVELMKLASCESYLSWWSNTTWLVSFQALSASLRSFCKVLSHFLLEAFALRTLQAALLSTHPWLIVSWAVAWAVMQCMASSPESIWNCLASWVPTARHSAPRWKTSADCSGVREQGAGSMVGENSTLGCNILLESDVTLTHFLQG